MLLFQYKLDAYDDSNMLCKDIWRQTEVIGGGRLRAIPHRLFLGHYGSCEVRGR